MIKTRCFPEHNYKAVYFNGKTIRFKIKDNKDITDLDYPEFYDIKLTNRCNGRCKYCYQDSTSDCSDYEAVDKLNKFFSNMTENEKPFQIAYGGGEPTLHYQFEDIMKLTREHGISPNYTTNGMFVINSDCMRKVEITKKYCEGVAVTCHKHLEKYWKYATELYLLEGIFTNFHNLISGKESIDYFISIYNEYHGRVKYFVLLPMLEHGRAKDIKIEYDYLFDTLDKLCNIKDIAFGANFYKVLKEKKYKVSLYEPEIMSKYLDLKDMALYKSSFDTEKPIKYIRSLK